MDESAGSAKVVFQPPANGEAPSFTYFGALLAQGMNPEAVIAECLPKIHIGLQAQQMPCFWSDQVLRRALRDFLDDIIACREERPFPSYLPVVTAEMRREATLRSAREAAEKAIPTESPKVSADKKLRALEVIDRWAADASNPNLAAVRESPAPTVVDGMGEFASPEDVEIDIDDGVEVDDKTTGNIADAATVQSKDVRVGKDSVVDHQGKMPASVPNRDDAGEEHSRVDERPAAEFFGNALPAALEEALPKKAAAITPPPVIRAAFEEAPPKKVEVATPSPAVTEEAGNRTQKQIFAELQRYARARDLKNCVEVLVANQWLCERHAPEIFQAILKSLRLKSEERRVLLIKLLIVEGWDLPPHYDELAEELASLGAIPELGCLVAHGGVSDGFKDVFSHNYTAGKALDQATDASKMLERALHELAATVGRNVRYRLTVRAGFSFSFRRWLTVVKARWLWLRGRPKAFLIYGLERFKNILLRLLNWLNTKSS